jgi:cell fate (sporulation/competence/biofilm development) regulator YlbF (YheA/YmcA/DUF963 family)
VWADLLQEMGQLDKSIHYLEQAHATFTTLGAVNDTEKVKALLQAETSEG